MAVSPGPPRPGRAAALDLAEGVGGRSRFPLLLACRPRLLGGETACGLEPGYRLLLITDP